MKDEDSTNSKSMSQLDRKAELIIKEEKMDEKHEVMLKKRKVINQSEGFSSSTTTKSHSFEPSVTLEQLRIIAQDFADERDWNQFHLPRNLVLALVGEVGELCEIFQWRGDKNGNDTSEWDEKDREHLGEELSDVLIYLLRLADQCKVDLSEAVLKKFKKNAAKYPAHLARGSSKKYHEYKSQTTSE